MKRLMFSMLVWCVSVSAGAQEPEASDVADEVVKKLEVPEFQTKTNPDSLLFYEAHLGLLDESLRDRKRIKDARINQTEAGLILKRQLELKKKGAVSQEDLDNAQGDFDVAVMDTKIAKAELAERVIEVEIATIQEKQHLGETVDFSGLKESYGKRWKSRQDIAKMTIERANAELRRQDARFARSKKLHGSQAESTQEYQHIKAARYNAQHAKTLAENRVELLTKIVDAYNK